MFAPSPRASKRQKTTTSEKNGSQNGKASDPLGKQAIAARRSARTRQQTSDVIDEGRSDFVDSAYHSLGTSPDEAERTGTAIGKAAASDEKHQNQSPEDASKNVRGKKRRNGKGNTEHTERPVVAAVSQASLAPGDNGSKESDSEGSVIEVRTSGRVRVKTWKSAELNAKNGDTKARHAPVPVAKNISDIPSSPSTRQDAEAGSRTTPQPAKSSTPASIKQSKLRMPSKRPGPASATRGAERVGVEESASLATGNLDQSVDMGTLAQEPETPRKGRARPSNSTPQKSTPRPKKRKSVLDSLLAQDDYRKIMISMKEHILRYIMATGPLPLCGEDHQLAYQKVYQILEQTVSAGEGNSMLLIGARGTAKTTLINTALRELDAEFKDQFHTVRLNGFVHTDDKLALKEIWRQLGREMAVEDSSQADRGNYADTMASLLALLSQPEELLQGDGDRRTSKSVVFILDEFDLFTTHSRQTLLYNLFDIAQSKKAPIAVIGLTTRIDVLESLEKRVKSRFSHRYTYVSHPLSFSAYATIVRTFLLASAYDTGGEIDAQFIKSPALDELELQHPTKLHEMRRAWSAHIDTLLANQSVLLSMNRHYSQTKSPQAFLNAFLLPVMRLPTLPEPADLLANELAPADSNLDLLPSLPDASLALLISAARLDIVCDTDTVTFNMAYDEYTRLAQRTRVSASASGMIAISGSSSGGSKALLSRDLALAAWERLEELGLLLPVAGQSGFSQAQGAGIDLGRAGRLVRVDVGLEEIGNTPGLELGAMSKWCKEI